MTDAENQEQGQPVTPVRQRQALLSNFAHLGASSVVGSLLALWATAHLARALGVTTFGAFNVARTLIDYALIPAGFGITVTASREIARSSDGAPELAGLIVVLRAVLGVLGGLGLAIASLFIEDVGVLLALGSMSLVIPFMSLNVDWLYSAHEDQRWPGFARTVGRLVYALLVVAFVDSASDLPIAGAALALESLVLCVMMWWPARHWFRIGRDALLGIRAMWRRLKEASHVGVANLAARLKTSADVLILAAFSTALMVGYYSAAYRLVLFVNSLAALYATVLLPRIARGLETGEARAVLKASFRATVLAGIAVGAGGAALAATALVTLMGPEYSPAAGVTTVLMAASGFIVVSMALGNTAVAIGKDRAYGRIATGAATLNVLVNLAVIPLFGMWGAALTTLVTEVSLVVALSGLMWRHGLSESVGWAWALRAGVLSALLFGSVWAVQQAGLGLLAEMATGVLVWLLGVVVFRLLSTDDWDALSKGSLA